MSRADISEEWITVSFIPATRSRTAHILVLDFNGVVNKTVEEIDQMEPRIVKWPVLGVVVQHRYLIQHDVESAGPLESRVEFAVQDPDGSEVIEAISSAIEFSHDVLIGVYEGENEPAQYDTEAATITCRRRLKETRQRHLKTRKTATVS